MILFWPIIATGLFDRDVTDEQAIRFPALYETGRLGLDPSRSFICLVRLGIWFVFLLRNSHPDPRFSFFIQLDDSNKQGLV